MHLFADTYKFSICKGTESVYYTSPKVSAIKITTDQTYPVYISFCNCKTGYNHGFTKIKL